MLSQVSNARFVIDDAVDLDPQAPVDFDAATCSLVNVMITSGNAVVRAAGARSIHARSTRRKRPFVMVCGQPLLDASHTPGARDVDDWFGRAAGGTLFIDLIGELSGQAQSHLLSRLADQAARGGAGTRPAKECRVRVIAGTDRSLSADVAAGAFSDGLFYRLNVIHITPQHR